MAMYSRVGGSTSPRRPTMGSPPRTRRDTSPFPGLSHQGGYQRPVSEHNHVHGSSPSITSGTTSPTRNGNLSSMNGISGLSNPTLVRNFDVDSGATVSTRALNKMIENAIGPERAVESRPAPEMMINKVIGIPSPVASMSADGTRDVLPPMKETIYDFPVRNQRFPLPRPKVYPNDVKSVDSHAFPTAPKYRSFSTPKPICRSHDEKSQVHPVNSRESGANSRFRDMSEPRGGRYQRDNYTHRRMEGLGYGDRSLASGECIARTYRTRDQSPSLVSDSFDERSRNMRYPEFEGRRDGSRLETDYGSQHGKRDASMGNHYQFSKSLYFREKERHSKERERGTIDNRNDQLDDKRYRSTDQRTFGHGNHEDKRGYTHSQDYDRTRTVKEVQGDRYDRAYTVDSRIKEERIFNEEGRERFANAGHQPYHMERQRQDNDRVYTTESKRENEHEYAGRTERHYATNNSRANHGQAEVQVKGGEIASGRRMLQKSPLITNVPCVVRQERKIESVLSELTLMQEGNEGKWQFPSNSPPEQQQVEHLTPLMEDARDVSDRTMSSAWKDDDTVHLPKGQVSAEAAIAAAAAASLVADPSKSDIDLDKAAKALSAIGEPSGDDVSVVLKSSVLNDSQEKDSKVLPVSYNSVRNNIEQRMTVRLTSETDDSTGIKPMTSFQFWTRCALAVSTAIMESDLKKIQLAHTAAEAVMTHGTSKMKNNWLQTAEEDLKNVTNAVIDTIALAPGGSGESMETLISTAMLNEGCKSIAMESLIIPTLLNKLNNKDTA